MTTSKRYEATIPLDPIPCPRPRVAVIRGHGVCYYPKAYKQWMEQFIGLLSKTAVVRFPGLVHVEVGLFGEKPKTSKLPCPRWDIDNGVKAVLDGMTTVGFWDDDRQVVSLDVIKRWALGEPAIQIHVEEIP